ncbi:hypothetical protein [Enterocloster clostridioformis]|uniref:hypothetical protein n=1 Tax=Enterocloster clostridioformis TaxID=1531 RepID=UPI0022E8CCAE|nr:hypothetical protein [Enterocloster clostridioformis]
MRRKKILALALAVTMASSMSMTSFAGQWVQDETNWRYEQDGSYATGWQWIDGKCYYFDGNGYMLADTTTPDGYQVGSDGGRIEAISRLGDYYLSRILNTYEAQPALEMDFDYDGTEKYVLSAQKPYPYVLDYYIKGRIGESEKNPNTWYAQDYDADFHIEFLPFEDNKWVEYWNADDGDNMEASYIGIINRWISFVDDNTFTITTEGRNYEYENYRMVSTYTRIR